VVLFALSLTPCFHDGHVRRARPGKIASMYMTSLTAYQKSKLSIAKALAVGTESEAPALGLGRIVSCHSLVAQITNRGHCLIACSCHRRMPASRLDPPHQFEWTVLISWIIVAAATAELKTGSSASPVPRNPRAFRRFSHLHPRFFGVPPELPYLSSEGLWLLKDQFRRSHIIFGTGFSA